MGYEADPDTQCTGKRRYVSRREARHAIAKVTRGGSGAITLDAYRCPHCPCWHIGNKPSAEAKAHRRAAAARRRGWQDDG